MVKSYPGKIFDAMQAHENNIFTSVSFPRNPSNNVKVNSISQNSYPLIALSLSLDEKSNRTYYFQKSKKSARTARAFESFVSSTAM